MFKESLELGRLFAFPRQTSTQKLPSSFAKDLFIDRVPEEVSCGVCSKVSMKPFFCSQCSKSFCDKCIDKARGCVMFFLNTSDISCPSCYHKSIKEASKTFRKRIEQLQIKCQSCSKTMQLSEFKEHNKTCSDSQVLCSKTGCGKKGLRKDFVSYLYSPPWISSNNFQTEYLTCSENCRILLENDLCLIDNKSRALDLCQNVL